MSNCGKEKCGGERRWWLCSALIWFQTQASWVRRKVSSRWPTIIFPLLLLVSSDPQMTVQFPGLVCCCWQAGQWTCQWNVLGHKIFQSLMLVLVQRWDCRTNGVYGVWHHLSKRVKYPKSKTLKGCLLRMPPARYLQDSSEVHVAPLPKAWLALGFGVSKRACAAFQGEMLKALGYLQKKSCTSCPQSFHVWLAFSYNRHALSRSPSSNSVKLSVRTDGVT